MAVKRVLFLLLQVLLLYPQLVGDGLGESPWKRQRVEPQLHWGRTGLLVPPGRGRARGAPLGAAPQLWHLAALAATLLLLSGLGRRRWEPHSLGHDEEQALDGEGDGEDAIVEEEQGEDGDGGDAEDEEAENGLGRILLRHMEWRVEDLDAGCSRISALMDNLTFMARHVLARTFYPVPQGAIGVGSAFEGWNPHRGHVLYQVLVPLSPPPGHTFQLELDTAGHIPGRNFRILVGLVCTCPAEQQGHRVLCFLHHPEQEPSLLHTLCSGSYLDVHKTARWFCRLLSEASVAFHGWHLLLLPSRRSCRLLLSDDQQNFEVEVLFGLQEGDSDVYVSSQAAQTPFTPRTVWPETYSVVELKFLRHIARRAPRSSCHLKCLQFLARALLGTRFSTYSVKTVLLHLLSAVPAAQWANRSLLDRLGDILRFLHRSLLEKRLDHFVLGNQRFPQSILLPPEVQMTEPPNLFHHLERDPAAYTVALKELCILQIRLSRLMICRH